MRPRFSVFIATSLDGYIARKDGGIDWLEIAEPLDESHGYDAFFGSIDTLVVGRGTYDTANGFGSWPYAGKRVIVMTHRGDLQHGAEAFAGTPQELLPMLAGSQRVYVDGGNVIRQFMAADLIDDMTISILPIVLGDGIRLFAGGEGEHRLVLERHLGWPTGVVQVRYRARG